MSPPPTCSTQFVCSKDTGYIPESQISLSSFKLFMPGSVSQRQERGRNTESGAVAVTNPGHVASKLLGVLCRGSLGEV